MSWEKVTLGDICKVYGGTTPSTSNNEYWNGKTVWLSPTDLPEIGEIIHITNSARKITDRAIDETSITVLPKGAVVYSTRASIGKIGIAEVPLTTNQGFVNFVCNGTLFNKFLCYTLKYFTPQIANLSNSTTFSEVSRTSIKNFRIPLPPLSVQQKISAILDKADELRKKDQLLLRKYDELLESIFYDMFGEPVTNEKGWDKKKMIDACTKITDGTHDTPKRLTEGVKFITGKHIRPGFVDYDNSDYVTEEVHKEIYRRCNPEYEDVLYTNIGVNLATAAMNTVRYEFSMKNVALLKPNKESLRGLYLENYLNNENVKAKIVSLTGVGGAQQFLSLNQIKGIQIVIPPITLQNKFVTIAQNIQEQKQQIKQQIEQSEHLFQGLLQSAFKGELIK